MAPAAVLGLVGPAWPEVLGDAIPLSACGVGPVWGEAACRPPCPVPAGLLTAGVESGQLLGPCGKFFCPKGSWRLAELCGAAGIRVGSRGE